MRYTLFAMFTVMLGNLLSGYTVSAATANVSCSDGVVVNASQGSYATTICSGSHTPVAMLAVSGSCGDVKTSVIQCSGGGDNPVVNALLEILNFVALGVGILVVGGIAGGGLTYARANGNSSTAQQGITIIVNSVIGLVLFFFMYVLVNWLVPGGLFG